MRNYLLPRFLSGYVGDDLYGSVGNYYPGPHEFYNPRENSQPGVMEQLRDYLFGLQYSNPYEQNNIFGALNYLIEKVNNIGDNILSGLYKGYNKNLKPATRQTKKQSAKSSTKSLKPKRDYYQNVL